MGRDEGLGKSSWPDGLGSSLFRSGRRRGSWTRSGRRRHEQVAERTGGAWALHNWRIASALWLQQALDAPNEVLWLKRFTNQLIRLHRYCFVGNAFVHHARHQYHGNSTEFRMLLDLAANGVPVLIRHNHVRDHNVRLVLFKLRQSGRGIRASDYIDVLAPKRDLDNFAHGCAVIDKINRWRSLCFRLVQRRDSHRLAHSASLSAMSCAFSSYSRMASSIRSVADRSTVRCGEVVP